MLATKSMGAYNVEKGYLLLYPRWIHSMIMPLLSELPQIYRKHKR
jgi:hypothetical protein